MNLHKIISARHRDRGYYRQLSKINADEMSFPSLIYNQVFGKDEYVIELNMTETLEALGQSNSGSSGFFDSGNWFIPGAFGIYRSAGDLGFHHNTYGSTYALKAAGFRSAKKIKVVYSFGTLGVYLDGVFINSVSGLSNINNIANNSIIRINSASPGSRMNVNVSKIRVNGVIFSLNEQTGFDVQDDSNTYTGTGQTGNTGGITYWNSNVIQEI